MPKTPEIACPFVVKKLYAALGFAWAGLRAAFASELAFRLEVATAAVALPLAMVLGDTGVERALLSASVLLVLMAELVNTAFERVCERISTDIHPVTKIIKDIGGGVVLLSLLNALFIWGCVLLG
jgi:diacylglycerol kinase (ATP)